MRSHAERENETGNSFRDFLFLPVPTSVQRSFDSANLRAFCVLCGTIQLSPTTYKIKFNKLPTNNAEATIIPADLSISFAPNSLAIIANVATHGKYIAKTTLATTN